MYHSNQNNFSRFLLIIFSLLLFSSTLAQVKILNGVYYPQKFKNDSKQYNLHKSVEDTLNYKTFDKAVEDFNIINGCGNYDSDQSNPNVAGTDDGYYLCVWEDRRTGSIEIDGQLFDSLDRRIGDVIKISDQYSNWNSEPQITFNRISREFIVTWAGVGYDIRLQRITETGEKINNNYTVTQQTYTNTNNPVSAVDQLGNILITWYSDNGYLGPIGLYYRLFDKNLNPVTEQRSISSTSYANVSSVGWDNRVVADSSGNFIVTWSGNINHISRIIIQQINNSGDPVNNNIVVSDPGDLSSHYFPTIAGIDEGYFLILWSDDRDLKGRIFNPDSGFVSAQFTVSDSQSTWFTYSVSSDNNDYFYIAFTGTGQFGQIINKYGNFLGNNRELGMGKMYATYPRLSNVLKNSLYCTYFGYRKNDIEAMLQKFDKEFNSKGNPVKLNTDICSSYQSDPIVKYNESGQSIMIWIDRRDGTDNLYAQVFDVNSNKIGGNFLVNDSTETYWISNQCITTDKDENFLISYAGGDYSSRNIFIQKISTGGVKVGNAVKVTDYYYDNPRSTIQNNETGNLLLCWINDSYYSNGYIQKFNSNLQSIGSVHKFLTGTFWSKKIFALAINKNFNILTIWADYNPNTQKTENILKGMICDEYGVPVSDTLYIDTLNAERNYVSAVCSIDNENNIVIEWSDCDKYFGYPINVNFQRRYLNNDHIQIYKNSINTCNIFTNMAIIKFENKKVFAAWDSFDLINSLFLDDNNHTQIPIRLEILRPYYYSWEYSFNSYSADIYEDRLLFAYESIINSDNGYDIWSNVQKINLFDFDPGVFPPANEAEMETVSSPFPNPVSNTANLKFQLVQPVNVNISVYNILGQKIMEIKKGVMEPGIYNQEINTQYLPSGIYFIYYKGIKTYAKKFLIVR